MAIDHTIASLHNLLSDLTIGEEKCTFECSSILLGTLTKEIESKQLCSSMELGSLSLAGITKALQTIRSPTWYDIRQGHYSRHSCSLQPRIQPIIADLGKYSAGLALEDLLPNLEDVK